MPLTGRELIPYPHPDPLVLHRPSSCWVCDLYPQEQVFRSLLGINYTGEYDPTKLSCPAEKRRTLADINTQYNNTARTRQEDDVYWDEWNEWYGEETN